MPALRVLLVLLFSVAAATAQQMPDPSQMAGRPLPAPELPTGTVSVRLVRERMGNNIVNHPVTLKAADRSLAGTTDQQGRAQFADVPPGTSVTVEAVVDGEALRSQEFAVPATGGVRVALIAGLEAAAARERAEADAAAKQPARAGIVVFGGETRIILEFQDDILQVFYLLDVVNSARTPIDVGQPLVIELPDAATGAATMQGSSSLAMVQGDRIRINGPFPPGTTSVQVGYRLPYRGDRVSIEQKWPAAIEQLFVAAEKVAGLQISSPHFASHREAQAGGTPFLMATGGRINAGETLTLTLSGLPHRSTIVRDVGVGAGLLVLAIGLWAGFTGARTGGARGAQLAERREKLFADLVALEEQHRRGRMDESRYAGQRQSLVAQLERVMGELDGASLEGPRSTVHGPRSRTVVTNTRDERA
jgi:hypothetical protein